MGYLKTGLLPGRLKEVAERRLDTLFKETVRFDRVVYLPFRGISIDGIRASKLDGTPTFRADRLVLKVPLLVFLVDKRVVIARATLEKPAFAVTVPDTDQPAGARADEIASADASEEEAPFARQIDVAGTLLDEGVDALLPENVYLEELVIQNGAFLVRDLARGAAAAAEIVRVPYLRVTFKKQPLIPIKGSLEFGSPRHTRIAFEGRWDLAKKTHELHLTGTTQKTPQWLRRVLARRGIALKRLESDFEVDLVPKKDDFYEFSAVTRRTSASLGWKNYALEGLVAFEIAGTWDMASKKTAFSHGSLTLGGASLKGLPRPIGALESVKGKLDFAADEIRFRNLRAVWNGAGVWLAGRFGLGPAADFELEAATRVPSLAFLGPLVPSSPQLDPKELRGDFEINASFGGSAEKPDEIKKKIHMLFRNASWKTPLLPEGLTDGRGECLLDGDAIVLKNIAFLAGKNPCALSGQIGLIPAVPSSVAFRGAGLRADSRFVISKNRIDIDELRFTWGKSDGRFHGTLATAVPNPLELEGNASIDLADMSRRLESKTPVLANLKPQGRAEIRSRVHAKLGSKIAPQWDLTAEAPSVRLFDKVNLENIVVDASSGAERTAITYGKAALYNGEIRFTGEVAPPREREPRFRLEASAMDIDLSKSARDFDFLDEEFSGLLNMDLEVGGVIGRRETFLGRGNFDIRHGRLFTTPLFKRLKNLLFVTIEGIDNLTFHQAQGNFKIGGGRIHTDDTFLSSPLINIRLTGDILLDRTLNLTIHSRFTPDLLRETDELGGFAPYVVNYAEQQITVYAVTGTLAQPIYTEQKARS